MFAASLSYLITKLVFLLQNDFQTWSDMYHEQCIVPVSWATATALYQLLIFQIVSKVDYIPIVIPTSVADADCAGAERRATRSEAKRCHHLRRTPANQADNEDETDYTIRIKALRNQIRVWNQDLILLFNIVWTRKLRPTIFESLALPVFYLFILLFRGLSRPFHNSFHFYCAVMC